MSRLPPRLDYLVIYNATLKSEPTDGGQEEDEDADEKAHVLFHVGRQQAVSRDRILRQVGLAKALTNFSEMFGSTEGCDSVHSTKKRLVMVTPEQDYWIHVSIDLARTPKVKSKSVDKDKDLPAEVDYDYHESSLQDSVLQDQIIRGYQEFKLLHGTFASVLSQSKDTLMRKLDNFYSIWSWKWDLESPVEFPLHLGIPLHPLSGVLEPLLNSFRAEHLPSGMTPVIILPPSQLIASQPISSRLPPALIQYLLSLIPPPPIPTPGTKPIPSAKSVVAARPIVPAHKTANGISTLNFARALPSVKNWGGFLSLNKVGNNPWRSNDLQPAGPSSNGTHHVQVPQVDKNVDQANLEDAISSETLNLPTPTSVPMVSPPIPLLSPALSIIYSAFPLPRMYSSSTIGRSPLGEGTSEEATAPDPDPPAPSVTTISGETIEPASVVVDAPDNPSLETIPSTVDAANPTKTSTTASDDDTASSSPTQGTVVSHAGESSQNHQSETGAASLIDQPPSLPPQLFSVLNIFLDSVDTTDIEKEPRLDRYKAWYLSAFGLMFALVGPSLRVQEEGDDIETYDGGRLEVKVMALLERVRESIDQGTTISTFPLETLRPTSNYVVLLGNQTTSVSGPGFVSTSGWLFNGREAVSYPQTLEQFSRTTTSQSWFISKKLPPANAGSTSKQVHMEVAKKEASLVDVDNELAGVVRKHSAL